jgi:hypothetical protein
MILHGKAKQVFDETETPLDRNSGQASGERINLRLNLGLQLDEEITVADLWSFFGGSIDSFSKKHLRRYSETLNKEAIRQLGGKGRLIEMFRQSLGAENRTRHGQVYIGIRKRNETGRSLLTINIDGSSAKLIPGYYELDDRLPFDLLDFNDVSKDCAEWVSAVLRTSANLLRDEMGVPRIGEGWVSETELFNLVKQAFPDVEVQHHGRPKWLGRQHFDIWLPKLRVAIEYHGAQHFRPVQFFGGESAFRATVERDKKKASIARRNRVHLIVVTEEMSGKEIEDSVYAVIRKRLNAQ